jgi:hypothetical protein
MATSPSMAAPLRTGALAHTDDTGAGTVTPRRRRPQARARPGLLRVSASLSRRRGTQALCGPGGRGTLSPGDHEDGDRRPPDRARTVSRGIQPDSDFAGAGTVPVTQSETQ